MAHSTKGRLLAFAASLAGLLLLGGCYQVEYKYDIPGRDADCPAGMNYRSGGSSIVDRSGGSAIVDRNSNDVTDYCYVPNCPGGYDDTEPAEIRWHLNDHHQVVADRTCLALPPPPPPGGGAPSSGGSTPGGTPPPAGGDTPTPEQEDDSGD